jgi:hypothetical protein
MLDLFVRFVVGGLAVVLCYVIARISPWSAFGGMFAAFPAVMSAAVVMAGISGKRSEAADVALGAVSGMLGGTVCVLSAIILMPKFKSWMVGLGLSFVIWAASAALFSRLIQHLTRLYKTGR